MVSYIGWGMLEQFQERQLTNLGFGVQDFGFSTYLIKLGHLLKLL